MQATYIVESVALSAVLYAGHTAWDRRRMEAVAYWESRGMVAKNKALMKRKMLAKHIAFGVYVTSLVSVLNMFPRLSEGASMAVCVVCMSLCVIVFEWSEKIARGVLERHALMGTQKEALGVRDGGMMNPEPQVNTDSDVKGSAKLGSAAQQPDLFDMEDPMPRAYRE